MTLLAKAGAALALMAATTLAHAWPDKPVKIVVPYPPGGNVDVAARLISPGLQAAFGQPFIVENKPGAGGMIAGEQVARAEPDGYTLFMAANGPLLFSPLIFKRQAYKWDKDFEPISSVSYTPLVLQVRPGLPVKTLGELLALARKEPGKLNMASPGAGTTNHLVSELLQSLTGARWTTAQYKGNAPATTDLLGGQVDFNFDQISVSLPTSRKAAPAAWPSPPPGACRRCPTSPPSPRPACRAWKRPLSPACWRPRARRPRCWRA